MTLINTDIKDENGNIMKIDPVLKDNLDDIKKLIRKDRDYIFAVDGYEGCLDGDTIIRTSRNALGRQYSIKHLYNQFHGNPDKIKNFNQWNLNIPTFVRSYDGYRIKLHKIRDVVYSGKKELFLLILRNNKSIYATIDHRFFTHNGWRELRFLTADDYVMCYTPKGKITYAQVKIWASVGFKESYDIQCEEPHHNFVANDMVVHNSGKSCFAFQIARYVDPSFELSRICFSAEEFAKQVMGSKKYTAIVYDEARSGLNARRAMSSINVTLTNMLAEIRQRNLFVFIVIPSAYDLDKNISLWRCKGLFHIFEINGDRGYFSYYGREKKKVLWAFYKKLYSYPTSQINFHGQFRDFYTIPEKAYRDKKASALKNYEAMLVVPKQVEEKEARRKVTKQVVDSLTARGMSKKEIAEVLGISLSMLRSDLKKIEMGVPPEAIENDEE